MKLRLNRDASSSFGLIIIFIILAAGIVASGVVYYVNYQRKYQQEVERQLSAIANLKSAGLIQYRKERLADAEVFFNNEIFSGYVDRYIKGIQKKQAELQIKMWLNHVQSPNQIDFIALTDTKGQVLLTVPENNVPIDSLLLHRIGQLRAMREIIFQDFYTNSINKKVYLSILVPLIHRGSLSGVLILRIDPSRFLYPFINRWPVPSRTAETILSRREGSRAVILNELRFRKNTALRLGFPLSKRHIPTVKAITNRPGVVKGYDYRGKSVIADVRPVPGTPWFMASRIDIEEVNAPLRERLVMIIFFVSLLVSASAIATFYIWKIEKQRSYRERLLESQKREELEVLNKKLSHEIEERIKVGNVIKKYTAELEDLYNNAPCGYHSLDEQGTIIRINNTELSWLGYSKEEVINRLSFKDIITEKSRDTFRREFPGFLKRGYVHDLEFEMQRKDGSIFHALLSASAIFDEKGKFLMSRTTVFDITEKKRSRERIEELNDVLLHRTRALEISNHELEAFAYSVSHDLRAPLRAIDGFARLLEDEYTAVLGDEAKRFLQVIRSNAQKMDTLIYDLLSLSRVSRTEMKTVSIDMMQLARDVYNECMNEKTKDSFEFIVYEMPVAKGDPVLIKHLWTNLISNAIKYTAPKLSTEGFRGKIEVGSILGEGKVEYYIQDNGIGFNQEYAHKLFGVFERLHNAESFEGTGVGLAIVERIIRRHNGSIRAYAKENEGAVFYFYIPQMET